MNRNFNIKVQTFHLYRDLVSIFHFLNKMFCSLCSGVFYLNDQNFTKTLPQLKLNLPQDIQHELDILYMNHRPFLKNIYLPGIYGNIFTLTKAHLLYNFEFGLLIRILIYSCKLRLFCINPGIRIFEKLTQYHRFSYVLGYGFFRNNSRNHKMTRIYHLLRMK